MGYMNQTDSARNAFWIRPADVSFESGTAKHVPHLVLAEPAMSPEQPNQPTDKNEVD